MPMKRPREKPVEAEPLWREQVGEALRRTRQESGLRLVDVAGRAGVAPQYLSELERGLKDPSSELLAAVAGALGLRVADVASRAISTTARPSGPLCLAA
jgi:transcriptional regulator with XRE-family HTH domain